VWGAEGWRGAYCDSGKTIHRELETCREAEIQSEMLRRIERVALEGQ